MSIRPVRVAVVMSLCAASVAVLIAVVSRPERVTPAASPSAEPPATGRQWFVGDGFFVAAQPADAAPGRLYTLDLARRRDVPRGEPFWIAVDADRPGGGERGARVVLQRRLDP